MSLGARPLEATIIVPTRNESHNVAELVERLGAALGERPVEVLFVDDSTDDTRAEIARVAAASTLPVRVLERAEPSGGLGGAVLAGMAASDSTWCVVMDGDLQHAPELVPVLLDVTALGGVDLVVGSRNVPGGSSRGLATGTRRWLSSSSTVLVRGLFPRRLASSSDPMSGFFAVRREAVDAESLRPRGFKILLEILVRTPLRLGEIPLVLEARRAGTSKGDLRQGMRLAAQIAVLRLVPRGRA